MKRSYSKPYISFFIVHLGIISLSISLRQIYGILPSNIIIIIISMVALLSHIVVFMNSALCFHNDHDHDRHCHHIVLVCPGLDLDQRTPLRTPRKTLCKLLQGSLSSCGRGERGQSALSVGRISLIVISLVISGTYTRSDPAYE